MTWTKLQLKNRPETLTIVNTHLDHVKSETRQEQIKVLSCEVKKIWDKNSSLIIMGDFNDSPKSHVRKTLMEEFPNLQDAWNIFNSVEESSHHSFAGETQNGSRIDWIMTDKRLKIISCEMDKSSNEGFYPTDHYPIICKISL